MQELKNLDKKFFEVLAAQREKINKYLRLKIQEIIMKFLLDKTRPLLKKKLKDPAMCDFVKKTIDDLIDEIYPEILEELQFQLRFFSNYFG